MAEKELTQTEIFEMLYKHEITKEKAMELLNRHDEDQNPNPVQEGFNEVRNRICKIVADNLHIDALELIEDISFKELGVDSINGIEIIRDINRNYRLNLDAVVIYDYPNITRLSELVFSEIQKISKISLDAGLHPHVKSDSEMHPDVQKMGAAGNQKNEIVEKISEIISSNLHLPKEELNYDISFKELGVDSINGIEIMRDVNQVYGLALDAVTIYDYSTIEALAEYVGQEKGKSVSANNKIMNEDILQQAPQEEMTGSGKIKLGKPREAVEPREFSSGGKVALKKIEASYKDENENSRNENSGNNGLNIQEGIAIVGMSGRFPGAKDIEELWSNLENGVDSVTEIPKTRWDLSKFYDSNPKTPGKTYSRVGGFLDNIETFDPLFFNISPNEAIYMDPQQRIFLEEAWKALEDAGCADSSLSGSKCGVFVGASQGDYMSTLAENGCNTYGEAFTGMATSILAARISYFLNLTGPSITIDTACSSSLVALHLACESIHNGESDMAIAGGIKLMLTPDLHISTSKLEMLSKSDKCRPFDQKADGTVMSEGVGAIVMMSLKKALSEDHTIYGIIKGSCINQDGRTNGITAPSMQSQTRLEIDTYNKANISPRDISFVEAHGTGTKLGDPIEVKALSSSFGEFTDDKQFCAIGSIKSNIGHSTSAAGIISVIKVLLAMKYHKIPATLHFDTQNEHLDFSSTPFYVNTSTIDWIPERGVPRTAAVSAFGFSGTNAHVVLQEYPDIRKTRQKSKLPYYLITLSAKTKEAYEQRIRDLDRWLELNDDHSIDDVAYTLHAGRSSFRIRGALVVEGMEELKRRIREIADTGSTEDYVAEYNLTKSVESSAASKRLEGLFREIEQAEDIQSYKSGLMEIARAYVNLEITDCKKVFGENAYHMISLPAYPFTQEVFWVEKSNTSIETKGGKEIKGIHPLLDKNISTFERVAFEKSFIGNEFFLEDHIVKDTKVLPAVAYLEMVRAAADLAMPGCRVASISNNYWLNAIRVFESGKTVKLSLIPDPEKSNRIAYEVTSQEADNNEVLHGKGEIEVVPEVHVMKKEILDLEKIKDRCDKSISGDECYQLFWTSGLKLGRSFQSIKNLVYNDHEGLAVLKLPEHLIEGFNKFKLHPTLLDGALEAVVGMINAKADTKGVRLPYYIGKVEIIDALTEDCFSYVQYTGTKKNGLNESDCYDVYILNLKGEVLAKVTDFSLWEIGTMNHAANSKKYPVMYFKKNWEVRNLEAANCKLSNILLFDNDDILAQQLRLNSDRVNLILPGESFLEINDKYYVNPTSKQDFELLIRTLDLKNELPSNILYMWAKDMDSQELLVPDPLDISIMPLLYLYQAMEHRRYDHIHMIYAFLGDGKSYSPYGAAFDGFSKSLMFENSKYKCKTLHFSRQYNITQIGAMLMNELQDDNSRETEIMYLPEGRYVRAVNKFSPVTRHDDFLLRQNGVYIITGGFGKLGMIFARYLAGHYKAKLCLTSRTTLNRDREMAVRELEALGGQVLFFKGDVSDYDDAQKLVNTVKLHFGSIHGILHTAGMINDAFLINKSKEAMEDVMSPKIRGTINLDLSTKDEELDFIVLFSSTSAVTGNIGQSDYAYANSYMDHYAQTRKILGLKNMRHGKMLSINWPVWEEGGMNIDKGTETLFKSFGVEKMESEAGIDAFLIGLHSDEVQIAVIQGDPEKVEEFLNVNGSGEQLKPALKSAELPKRDYMDSICKDIKKAVSDILRIKEKDIFLHKEMSEYGFNSLTFTELTNRMNDLYRIRINPSIFFEYPTLSSFAAYLAEEHCQNIQETYGRDEENDVEETSASSETSEPVKEEKLVSGTREPIAIIGISGIMPQSEDLLTFWENLKEAKNLITEVPAERWDIKNLPDNISKWGGFMKEIDKFDPLFFGISPLEAELMDPQQRIFMQTVWSAIEDAGYKPADLSDTKTAVFVGVSTTDYRDVLQGNEIEALTSTGNSHCILANRISYLLNLHGPSEPIDTACSSSLVAIHRGMEAIYNGDCDTAIVGGVNVLASPTLHISFSKAGMLSPDGVCRTFDEGANGYVRGEGAGAIWLKPLSRAKKDGDPIYALIKGTAVNHGGRAASLTAPNPTAQAKLMVESFDKAGFSPETITYIEAHGTGTQLGDPIEINGLKKAFAEMYHRTGTAAKDAYCGIGSVKPNIGHLETAAGIASVLKVVLALKHKTLPGLANFNRMNPYIQLEKTPFYLVEKTQVWKAQVDDAGNEMPRRAGISSFGFGGMNAHVAIEEYKEEINWNTKSNDPQIIILSAKSKNQLTDYAGRMLTYLQSEYPDKEEKEFPLQSIAFTLQTGREEMEERLAFVAATHTELISKLKGFVCNEERDTYGIHQNTVKSIRTGAVSDAVDQEILTVLIEKGDMNKIASLWIEGFTIDWSLLHSKEVRKRIPLPAYPFEKRRIWKAGAGIRDENYFYLPRWEKQDSNPEILGYDYVKKHVLIVVPEKYDFLCEYINDKFRESMIYQIILGNRNENYGQYRRLIDVKDERAIAHCIDKIEELDYLFYFGGMFDEKENCLDSETLDDMQEYGIYSLFRLVKALAEKGFDDRKLCMKVMTNNTCRLFDEDITPYAGSVLGFLKSMAKEFPYWSVSCIDVDKKEFVSDEKHFMELFMDEPLSKTGEETLIRKGDRYRLKLEPVALSKSLKTSFRWKGVYMIVGGAGGIGLELCRYLAKEAKGRIILIGRSDLTSDKQKKISEIEEMGAEILYIKADVTNKNDMDRAVKEAKQRFGKIHGVIHSAIVMRDMAIKNMSEDDLKASLAPKVQGSLVLYNAIREEELDFMMFFSSIQSFVGNAGQANYAAACAFKDSFALYLNSAGKIPIKIIHWGYWGSVGVASSDKHNKLMEKAGLLSIEPEEGMDTIERVLSSDNYNQIVMLKATDKLIEQSDIIMKKHDTNNSVGSGNQSNIKHVKVDVKSKVADSQDCGELIGSIQEVLKECVAGALKMEEKELDFNEQFSEYGVDSITAVNLLKVINNTFGITLKSTILFDYSNIHDLSDYLCKNYRRECGEALKKDQGDIQEKADLSVLERLADGSIDVDEVMRRFTD
ncbi:SDR family NAD(P)-dependent oxidoreductase [Lacrimispora sp. 38-1]|uniref:SDR family NAD(P)-dependent oxidoreductase n=1 Tax=Lacrimispora sp. 38-1 TaxID=3125778 RepID=UPI003CF49059